MTDPVTQSMLAPSTDPVVASMLAPHFDEVPAGMDRGTFSPGGALVQTVTGAAGAIAGGLRGLNEGLWDLGAGRGWNQAAKDASTAVRNTEQAVTIPANPATQEAMASDYNPLNWVGMLGKKAGETAQDLGASPGVSTAIETGINALPMALGVDTVRGALGRIGKTVPPVITPEDVVSGNGPTINPQAYVKVNDALKGTGLSAQDLPVGMATDALNAAGNGLLRNNYLKAQAEAAQVGTHLTEGQATGDPALYSHEVNSAGVVGGEPYAQVFAQQRAAVHNYLNKTLGAESAADPVEAGRSTLARIATIDQQMQDAITQAYDKVKNSEGRSANLDAEHFYMDAQGALEHDNVTQFVPPEIGNLYDSITSGKLPLTVDTMTAFDKILSRAQRSLTDGNQVHAVGVIRNALNNTPVADSVGADAIQAYQQARSMARQRFELADPKSQNYVPAYAAMRKTVGNASNDEFLAALQNGTANADPGSWFQTNVMRGKAGDVQKLGNYFRNNGAADQMGIVEQGALSSIKDAITKGNPDIDRTGLAAKKLQDSLQLPSMPNVLSPKLYQGLQYLSNTLSRMKLEPEGGTVNWSKSAVTHKNFQSGVGGAVGGLARHAVERQGPLGRIAVAAKDVATEGLRRRSQRMQAEQSLQPNFASKPTPPTIAQKATEAAEKGIPLSQLLGQRNNQ